MDNKRLIDQFYRAFAAGDAALMNDCYTDDVVFQDAVFGTLQGQRAKNMWSMLLQNREIKISFGNVQATGDSGSAEWTAIYTFTRTGRKVINEVSARFTFSHGKIISHTDTFDFWKWAGQAFGTKGYLFGWMPFFRKKVHRQALAALDRFSAAKSQNTLT